MCWIWECLHLIWNRFTLILVDIDKIYQRKSFSGCSERKIIRWTKVERRTWTMRRMFFNGLAFWNSNDLCRRLQHRKRDSLMNLLPKCYTAKKWNRRTQAKEYTWSSQKEKNFPHNQNRSEFMGFFSGRAKHLNSWVKRWIFPIEFRFWVQSASFCVFRMNFHYKKIKTRTFFYAFIGPVHFGAVFARKLQPGLLSTPRSKSSRFFLSFSSLFLIFSYVAQTDWRKILMEWKLIRERERINKRYHFEAMWHKIECMFCFLRLHIFSTSHITEMRLTFSQQSRCHWCWKKSRTKMWH